MPSTATMDRLQELKEQLEKSGCSECSGVEFDILMGSEQVRCLRCQRLSKLKPRKKNKRVGVACPNCGTSNNVQLVPADDNNREGYCCGNCKFEWVKFEKPGEEKKEMVNHPKHYNDHPAGIECIDVIEAFNFNLGSSMKYIWRAGLKSPDPIEDIDKALWYLDRERARIIEERKQ